MRRLNGNQAREVVTVSPDAAGGGAWGEPTGTDVDLRVIVLSRSKLVRDRNGAEVVSEVTLLVAPEHNAAAGDLEALLAPGTTVTVRAKPREVISTGVATNRGRVIYVSASLT